MASLVLHGQSGAPWPVWCLMASLVSHGQSGVSWPVMARLDVVIDLILTVIDRYETFIKLGCSSGLNVTAFQIN